MSEARHWLLKTEPGSYSIDDLKRDGRTGWSGVRNYQARNYMRDLMRVGDGVLFYHSSVEPPEVPGVVGVARIASKAKPDPSALDSGDSHFDPKSTEDEPIWVMVEVEFVAKFRKTVSLDDLRGEQALNSMLVLKRGQRLSVQPVETAHYERVVKMGRA